MTRLTRFFYTFVQIAVLSAVLHNSLYAATVIDVQARGMKTRLMMNQAYARVDNAADGSYLLLDRKTRQSYLVLPQSRQVMPMPTEPNRFAKQLKIQLQPQPVSGAGIMGFPTQRYRMLVNNQFCGDVFASRQAMQQLKVATMLDAVASMVDQQLTAMGPYIAVLDDCTQASMSILSHSSNIGLPMRLYDNKGGLLSDIVNIDTDAKLPPAQLAFPADYQLVASIKQLSPTQTALKNARRYSPGVDKAYRQVEEYVNRFGERYRQYLNR
jgi:hypothetical protein